MRNYFAHLLGPTCVTRARLSAPAVDDRSRYRAHSRLTPVLSDISRRLAQVCPDSNLGGMLKGRGTGLKKRGAGQRGMHL